jgi:probable F420-dependent oxidoreductase
MTDANWTSELGAIGVWRGAGSLSGDLAATIEALGYGAIWIGQSPGGDLAIVEELLEATSSITIATGIVNIWKDEPAPIAAAYHRLEERFPGRFLLGIGVGHPEATGARYSKPYAALVSYLDALDQGGVPAGRRVLAALGDKVLQLSVDRAAGAHPYLTTPEHTRHARSVLGAGALLVPEQKVVLDPSAESARKLGRANVEFYLKLSNYVNNLRTLGFDDDDLAAPGSDRLIDALALHGTASHVATGLRAHLDAGADQIAIQLLTEKGESPVEGLTLLAAQLMPSSP